LGVIARFNPLTYGIDGLRTTLTGLSQLGIVSDVTVVVAFSVLFVAIGAWLFERIEV
jgi:ABC-2 type transport system permease protein